MIINTSRKSTTTIQCTTNVVGGITSISIPLKTNQCYRRVKRIASLWGGNIPPRRGFGYVMNNGKKTNLALWCINLSDNPYWENVLCDNGNTLKERKVKGETPKSFQARIFQSEDYDVNVKRLCFAKKRNIYYFIGMFHLSELDFDTQTAVFKKDRTSQFIFKVKTKKKVVFTFEEETEIVINAQTL